MNKTGSFQVFGMLIIDNKGVNIIKVFKEFKNSKWDMYVINCIHSTNGD